VLRQERVLGREQEPRQLLLERLAQAAPQRGIGDEAAELLPDHDAFEPRAGLELQRARRQTPAAARARELLGLGEALDAREEELRQRRGRGLQHGLRVGISDGNALLGIELFARLGRDAAAQRIALVDAARAGEILVADALLVLELPGLAHPGPQRVHVDDLAFDLAALGQPRSPAEVVRARHIAEEALEREVLAHRAGLAVGEQRRDRRRELEPGGDEAGFELRQEVGQPRAVAHHHDRASVERLAPGQAHADAQALATGLLGDRADRVHEGLEHEAALRALGLRELQLLALLLEQLLGHRDRLEALRTVVEHRRARGSGFEAQALFALEDQDLVDLDLRGAAIDADEEFLVRRGGTSAPGGASHGGRG